VLADEEAEAVVPIDRPIPGTDRVQVYALPQAQVASAVHQGDFAGFTRMHAALLTWIEANGYRIVGPYREVYIRHDRSSLNETTTEVQYPIDRAE
jgi:effector-binding domain-containing protein